MNLFFLSKMESTMSNPFGLYPYSSLVSKHLPVDSHVSTHTHTHTQVQAKTVLQSLFALCTSTFSALSLVSLYSLFPVRFFIRSP